MYGIKIEAYYKYFAFNNHFNKLIFQSMRHHHALKGVVVMAFIFLVHEIYYLLWYFLE